MKLFKKIKSSIYDGFSHRKTDIATSLFWLIVWAFASVVVFFATGPDREFSFNYPLIGYLVPIVFAFITLWRAIRFFLLIKWKKENPKVEYSAKSEVAEKKMAAGNYHYCMHCAATLKNGTDICPVCGKYNKNN